MSPTVPLLDPSNNNRSDAYQEATAAIPDQSRHRPTYVHCSFPLGRHRHQRRWAVGDWPCEDDIDLYEHSVFCLDWTECCDGPVLLHVSNTSLSCLVNRISQAEQM